MGRNILLLFEEFIYISPIPPDTGYIVDEFGAYVSDSDDMPILYSE